MLPAEKVVRSAGRSLHLKVQIGWNRPIISRSAGVDFSPLLLCLSATVHLGILNAIIQTSCQSLCTNLFSHAAVCKTELTDTGVLGVFVSGHKQGS